MPLNSILGWATIVSGRVVTEAQVAQGLEVIERNARLQVQLIEDLLDRSRIASGKMRLDVPPVDPVSFIEAAIATVKPAADAKGLMLSAELDPSAGPITGDPIRLQQVVWNLLILALPLLLCRSSLTRRRTCGERLASLPAL
jgi:signal transduction histidine kinase